MVFEKCIPRARLSCDPVILKDCYQSAFCRFPHVKASDVRPAGSAWFVAQTGYVSFATFFFELPTLPIAICTIFRNQKRLTRKSPVAPALHRTWDSDRKV